MPPTPRDFPDDPRAIADAGTRRARERNPKIACVRMPEDQFIELSPFSRESLATLVEHAAKQGLITSLDIVLEQPFPKNPVHLTDATLRANGPQFIITYAGQAGIPMDADRITSVHIRSDGAATVTVRQVSVETITLPEDANGF